MFPADSLPHEGLYHEFSPENLEDKQKSSVAQSARRYTGQVLWFKHREHVGSLRNWKTQFRPNTQETQSSQRTEKHKTVVTQRRPMCGITFLFCYCKRMKNPTPDIINFKGDEAILSIKQFHWSLAGFALVTILTLWMCVTVTIRKVEK